MKYLLLKLLRDIKHTLGQFISILMVLAVGCFFFAGMMEAATSIDRQVREYYVSQNFADATGTFLLANDAALESVRNVPGVTAAEGRYTVSSSTRLASGEKQNVTVVTLTERVNVPDILSGTLPKKASERAAGERPGCLLDKEFAEKYGIVPGDTFRVFLPEISSVRLAAEGSLDRPEIGMPEVTYTADDGASATEFVVSGVFHSPEYIYKVDISSALTTGGDFAALLVRPEDVQAFDETVSFTLTGNLNLTRTVKRTDLTTRLYNQIVVDAENADLDALFGAFAADNPDNLQSLSEKLLGSLGNVTNLLNDTAVGFCLPAPLSYLQKDHPSETAFQATFQPIKNLVAVLPALFFVVAAIITFISLSKTVENQRTQIGVMQAMGIEKKHIYATYLGYAVIAALIGSLVGGLAGVFIVPHIYHWIFSIQFVMPPTKFAVSPAYVFLGLAIALAVSFLAAFISCHRTLKEIPAAALRPKPPKKTRKILLERFKGFWRRIGFGSKMIFRNIYLHKLRILLSSVGVVGCVAMLIAGVGLKDRISFILDDYNHSIHYDLQLTANEAMTASPESAALITGMDATGNIRSVEFVPRAAVKVSAGGVSSESLALTALPSGSDALRLYNKENNRREQFRIAFRADTVILPHLTAAELGVSAGDTVTLTVTTAETGVVQKQVTVTDVSYQYAGKSVYCSYDVFSGTLGLPLSADTAFLSLADPSAVGATQASLKTHDDLIKGALSLAEINEVIAGYIRILDTVVLIFVVGAAVLAIAVIYNITSINVFERTREIATLMVLGYKRYEIDRLILVENLVITAIGCLLGIPLGYGLFLWLATIVGSMSVTMPTNLTAWVVLLSTALAFLFTLAATLILNKRMQKISMVEALKSVE